MKSTVKFDEFLSEIEKDKLALFIQDDYMREAVKKCLLAGLYYNGTLRKDEPGDPLRNAALSLVSGVFQGGEKLTNEQLGEDLRALWSGINTLESAFSFMTAFKKEETPKKVEKNEAR